MLKTKNNKSGQEVEYPESIARKLAKEGIVSIVGVQQEVETPPEFNKTTQKKTTKRK